MSTLTIQQRLERLHSDFGVVCLNIERQIDMKNKMFAEIVKLEAKLTPKGQGYALRKTGDRSATIEEQK